ncbi:hypothetical protein Tco_0882232 [Tanacetum coccineum]
MEQMTSICDLAGQIIQKKEKEKKRIAEEQADKERYWKIPLCHDDDEDYTITITPDLATEEPVNSLSMGDEHLDTILATESDEDDHQISTMLSPSREDDSYEKIDCQMASPPDSEIVSLEVVEIVIPEVGGIDDILLTIKDDILQNSSGSTTTRFDYSLPDYEAFYSDDDHIKEKSSGSTTTHADFSQYDSFIFDLSINPFPPADRSDFYHEEFAGELAHIISPLEYDCFCFKIEPELGNFTMDVVEDIFPTREPRIHVLNVLPTHPTLNLDLDFILSSESLFAYVVWILSHP